MDPTQLESYYAEFVRYIQVNRLCQGKLLMDHGKLYPKLWRFSVATMTWLMYDFRKHAYNTPRV